MRLYLSVVFLFLTNLFSITAQEKLIEINWVNYKNYVSEFNNFNVPYFDNHRHNFEPTTGITLTTQWE